MHSNSHCLIASEVDGYDCQIKDQAFSECAPQVKYCRDNAFQSYAPRDRVCIAGCHCSQNGYLVNDYDTCVPVEDCTCYDDVTDKIHEAGEKVTRSCGDW